jgi:carbonic anhydrase
MKSIHVLTIVSLLGYNAFAAEHAAPGPKAAKAQAHTVAPAPSGHVTEPVKTGPTPDEAIKKLISGNQRYVSATMSHERQTVERRGEMSQGQKPFAIIVSCSDSRVPPEVIFDQGIGDLFVVRSAGEVVTEVGVGSIEYAVEHLGAPLIMVLGHERCGAVKATADGGEAPGSIGSICRLIQPAVDKAKGQSGDLVDNAVRNNISLVAGTIASSPIVRKAIEEGKVKVVKAYYDLDEGTVKPVQ